jgi:hypothetical protein
MTLANHDRSFRLRPAGVATPALDLRSLPVEIAALIFYLRRKQMQPQSLDCVAQNTVSNFAQDDKLPDCLGKD